MYALIGTKLAQIAVMLNLLSLAVAAIPPAEYVIPAPVVPPERSFKAEVGNVSSGQGTPSQGEIRSFIARSAKFYGISGYLALELAWIESRFDYLARNPSSSAKGIYQFLDGSQKLCGNNFDVFDVEDNVRCAHRLLSEDSKNIRHWSADLNTRRKLLNAGFIECFPGKNNCDIISQ